MESMHKNIDKDTKMIAVVKTNGYGHGAMRISREVEDLPYLWGYAVATVDEAEELIADGRTKPILILGITFPDKFETIVDEDIRPAISEFAAAKALSEVAVNKEKVCSIHIAVDTGMSRIGFQVTEESADMIAQISALPNINIEGIFTHFARADELSKEPTYAQMALFQEMIDMLEARGVKIPLHHCSNSAGIVEIPEANMNLVRAGITMYGLWPSEEVRKDIIDIHPVMSLKSHIVFIKELDAGRQISYGGIYVTDSKRRIATIPVGPICGRVCMDQFMVDVTDIPEAQEGDRVTLLGRDHDACITLEELGELSGRFNYEFACLITPRVPRVYFRGSSQK